MPSHRRVVIPFSDAPRGTCRWCGEPIFAHRPSYEGEIARRMRWHPACSAHYRLIAFPQEGRRYLYRRDGGVCRHCGVVCASPNALDREWARQNSFRHSPDEIEAYPPGFCLDHIVPLVDGGSHEPDNWQLLCVECHKVKTAQEASQRAVDRAVD